MKLKLLGLIAIAVTGIGTGFNLISFLRTGEVPFLVGVALCGAMLAYNVWLHVMNYRRGLYKK